jgi:hypothetical protein
MKESLCLLITSAALAGQLSAEKLPATVKESFQTKFPGASKV